MHAVAGMRLILNKTKPDRIQTLTQLTHDAEMQLDSRIVSAGTVSARLKQKLFSVRQGWSFIEALKIFKNSFGTIRTCSNVCWNYSRVNPRVPPYIIVRRDYAGAYTWLYIQCSRPLHAATILQSSCISEHILVRTTIWRTLEPHLAVVCTLVPKRS